MSTGQQTAVPFVLHPSALIAVGICPALAGAVGLREAAVLGAIMVVVQLLTIGVLMPVRGMILPRFTYFFITVVAGGFTAAFTMVGMAFVPALFQPVAQYAYLAPAGLPVLCAARWLRRDGGKVATVTYNVALAAGAAAMLVVVGATRELLGTGSLLEKTVSAVPPLPWVATVPGGVAVVVFTLGMAAMGMNFRSRKRAGV